MEQVKRLITGRKGVTLVEVVVSVLIISIVIVPVVAVLVQGTFLSNRIDKVYDVSNLAKQRMDSLKKFDFEDIPDIAVETATQVNKEGDIDADGDYIRTTEVVDEYDGYSHLLKVKVTVDRLDEDGIAEGHPIVMETLFVNLSSE